MTIFEKTTKIYWVNQNDYLTLILWNIKHFWYKQKKRWRWVHIQVFYENRDIQKLFSKQTKAYLLGVCMPEIFSVQMLFITFPRKNTPFSHSFCYRKLIIHEPVLKKNKQKQKQSDEFHI